MLSGYSPSLLWCHTWSGLLKNLNWFYSPLKNTTQTITAQHRESVLTSTFIDTANTNTSGTQRKNRGNKLIDTWILKTTRAAFVKVNPDKAENVRPQHRSVPDNQRDCQASKWQSVLVRLWMVRFEANSHQTANIRHGKHILLDCQWGISLVEWGSDFVTQSSCWVGSSFDDAEFMLRGSAFMTHSSCWVEDHLGKPASYVDHVQIVIRQPSCWGEPYLMKLPPCLVGAKLDERASMLSESQTCW